ncbi:Hypothetical protein, predicted transmembrane protein, putative PAP2 family protein [Mycoplasma yeatsii 13926]|uniref:Phosphatidic acid phosphatase type 2/haloperoxidase domain-containing protein n=1 Tax=Mycoplasma yeatsii 13926 TaxID=1188240 RepID=S6G8W4_9MOLU|nr:phosphatase PAP2 family protein [Mycoplasma yeatsii]EOA07315.1 Hypothetical protein, predicted transmembrane protein, putative PAP2 family protein [Mycoplasma yeatsii 13926]
MLGNVLLTPFICFACMVVVESWFLYKSKNNQLNFWSKNKWIIKVIYLLILIWSLLALSIGSYLQLKKGNGFGSDGDAVFLMSMHYRKVALIFSIIVTHLIMIVGFCLLHFKFARSQNFLSNQYWIESIKVILFAIVTYIIIVLLKGMTSRVYYYNVVYADLLEKMKQEGHQDWVNVYLNQTEFKHGLVDGNNNVINIEGDWAWYVINGTMFHPRQDLNFYHKWVEWAFPSGHIIGTLTMSTTFFFFLSNKKKLSYINIIFLVIFLLHLLSMSCALVVDRGHWFSDVCFSYLFGLPLIWVVHKIGEKIKQRINNKK